MSFHPSQQAVTLTEKVLAIMDIVLHLGVHRTGTTTFQDHLRRNSDALDLCRVQFWGPHRTRNGLFSGLAPQGVSAVQNQKDQRRAVGRVQLHLRKAEMADHAAVLISEENMIGSVRANIREGELYPAIGERMSRYARAFGQKVSRVVLSIRSQDKYWASALAFGVQRGHPMPGARKLDAISSTARSWRDVITDLACAMPDTDIRVMPFEEHTCDTDMILRAGLGLNVPLVGAQQWLNRAPELAALRTALCERGQDPAMLPQDSGGWRPFSAAQSGALRETYQDDLMWLDMGADGLATRVEDDISTAGRGETAHLPATPRGQTHDKERHLDHTG